MKTFKLLPIDGRKSLNNHHVNEYEFEGEKFSDLVSYTTRIASYNHTTNEMSVYSINSNTTLRHIKAFLDFYGFNAGTKQEIIKEYNVHYAL